MSDTKAASRTRRRIAKWLVILTVGLAVLSQVPAWLSRRHVDQRFVGKWIVRPVAADPPPLTGGMGGSGGIRGMAPWGLVLRDNGKGTASIGLDRILAGETFLWKVESGKLLIKRQPPLRERVERAFYRATRGPGWPDDAVVAYEVSEVSADEIELYAGMVYGEPLVYHLRRSE